MSIRLPKNGDIVALFIQFKRLMLYQIADYILTIFHLFIILFTLFGWFWLKTRKLHFIVVCITLFCWLVLGIWFGVGYCPITDWQWQLKESLGEKSLPASFVKYFADKISGRDIDAGVVDLFTGIGFLFAIFTACYFRFLYRKAVIRS